MEAAKSEAFRRPKANSQEQYSPASGASAWAASLALSIFTPFWKSVIAQSMMMKKATTLTMIDPKITSIRVYW